MGVVVVLVVMGLVFFVGMLLGQEWNRRELRARQRRVVALQRERDDLAHLLDRFDDRRRRR